MECQGASGAYRSLSTHPQSGDKAGLGTVSRGPDTWAGDMAPPTNPSDWEPATLPLKLKVGTTFFGKSETVRPKIFIFDQTFLNKKGVSLRWDAHSRLTSNYNDLKCRFKKKRAFSGGV
jgi:hypothetical protein